MDELTIGDKIYISSKKAAQVTGYAKDYVGQLCREGHVEARMVGRNWYVLESSIRAHRFGAPAEEVTAPESVNAPADEPLTWKAPVYAVESAAPIKTVDPVLPRKSINILDSETPETQEIEEGSALSTMHDAWREWFDTRKGETYLETPEVIDAREESQEPEVVEAAPIPTVEAEPVETHEEVVPVAFTPIAPTELPLERSQEPSDELEQGAEPVRIQRAAKGQPLGSFAPVGDAEILPARKATKQKKEKPARIIHEKRVRQKKSGGSVVLRVTLIAIVLLVVAATTIGTGYAQTYMPKADKDNILINYLGGTRTVEKTK